MASDDTIILNQGYEIRTSKTGKVRATVVVRSEPIAVNLDPKTLGAPVAAAIAHHFRERIKGITELASFATQKARKVAAKAFADGRPWALKRYSGGKTGSMPPNQSDRAFNDSGRFADTIRANASNDGAWRVNVAANRLDGSTSGGVERIWNRLVSLVPEFGNPALLLQNDIIRKAIEKTRDNMHQKREATSQKLGIELFRAGFELFHQLGEFGDLLDL